MSNTRRKNMRTRSCCCSHDSQLCSATMGEGKKESCARQRNGVRSICYRRQTITQSCYFHTINLEHHRRHHRRPLNISAFMRDKINGSLPISRLCILLAGHYCYYYCAACVCRNYPVPRRSHNILGPIMIHMIWHFSHSTRRENSSAC
jgi:hypothetical protein